MKALGPLAPQAEGLLVLPTVPGEVVCSLAGFNIAQTMYLLAKPSLGIFLIPEQVFVLQGNQPSDAVSLI